ncbi:Endonuclease 2 [Ananas comosus]|uniref:Aspergillus nuclease S1 n=1 Tax=Ananas comosus TaxID=4615 RepID=A0A199UM86_ANACO|nr:Endonuclease 2 [Ananas comosus]
MGLLLLFHVVLVAMVASVPCTHAWGKDGHYMVCKVAEQYLTRKASRAVMDLLPEEAEGEFASVCSWADQVRFRYRWASPLHYINTPAGVCNFDYERDCHNSKGQQHMCVVGAINNFTMQLQTYYEDPSSEYNLPESLKFLAHFMGDVHQPMHVGFDNDEGGNTIAVHWYRRKSNLHHVEYASESIQLACDYAYKDVDQGSTLEDDYFLSRLPVIEKRIAQAGVRLATLLNRIFSRKVAQYK